VTESSKARRALRPGHLATLVCVCALARPTLARAQSAQDKAVAEALFEEAQKLVADSNYDAACPKFAESARLARGVGVMLYLADCYEHQGKTASAWVLFRDAEDLAQSRGDAKRAGIAHGRATALFAQMSNLVLTVAPEAVGAGVVVKRDGEVVGPAQYGIEVPLDPGKHTLEATAPGKAPWTKTIDVPVADKTTVAIPPLEDAHAEPPPSPVPSDTKPEPPAPGATHATLGTQRLVGIGLGGGGVLGVLIGSIFGGLALSKLNASNGPGECAADNHCSESGASLRYAAQDRATVSTVGFVMGGLLLAGGAATYFTAPHPDKTVGLTIVPTGLGVAVAASF
jgi:hypothetical protein